MDADRAKVRPQVVLLCQPVCGPDYCLPFEAPDMLLASVVPGMTLVGHDMGSAQHTRCSSRGARRHLLELHGFHSLHQAWHMADCRLYGRWRACSGKLTKRSTTGWTPCLVQRTRCDLRSCVLAGPGYLLACSIAASWLHCLLLQMGIMI